MKKVLCLLLATSFTLATVQSFAKESPPVYKELKKPAAQEMISQPMAINFEAVPLVAVFSMAPQPADGLQPAVAKIVSGKCRTCWGNYFTDGKKKIKFVALPMVVPLN